MSSNEQEVGCLTQLLLQNFSEKILEHHQHRGDETVTIDKSAIVDVCRFLRDDPKAQFDMMVDLTAVDFLAQGKEPRFEVVYHLKSMELGHRIRIKAPVSESDCEIDSVHSLWKAVDWYERECYDMYGIVFKGHPNLKRLLMYDEFVGHPLRKDYPVDKQQPLVDLYEVEERYSYERS